MLKWHDSIYTDEKTDKKLKQIRWRLNHGAGSFQVYLITLSTESQMQLDIFHAGLLKQPVFRRRLPMIVGVASSYNNAQTMVVRIVQDVLERTGGADVRAYFESTYAEVN